MSLNLPPPTSNTEHAGGNTRLPDRRPLLYAITGRKTLRGEDLGSFISRAIDAGIDLIQIREKGLPDATLLTAALTASSQAVSTPSHILLNDRFDIALAARAAGVHLPVRGLPLAGVRRQCPGLLIGVSTHNLDELRRGADEGADFAVFGPVFPPLSKSSSATPTGLEGLTDAVRAVNIPVLALGGITLARAPSCLQAGAAGLAGISLFQESKNLGILATQLRSC